MLNYAKYFKCFRLSRGFCDATKYFLFRIIDLPVLSETEDGILATRPLKGLLWGDGKVFLKYQRVKFRSKKVPSIKRIQKFLEHEQATNINFLDLQQFTTNTIFSKLLICSGLSPRHISRIAYGLLKALKQAEVPHSDIFQVLGTRESG